MLKISFKVNKHNSIIEMAKSDKKVYKVYKTDILHLLFLQLQ